MITMGVAVAWSVLEHGYGNRQMRWRFAISRNGVSDKIEEKDVLERHVQRDGNIGGLVVGVFGFRDGDITGCLGRLGELIGNVLTGLILREAIDGEAPRCIPHDLADLASNVENVGHFDDAAGQHE